MTQRHNKQRNKHSSVPSRRHLLVAWAGVVVCGALLATAILVLIEGAREWRIGSASLGWPSTPAVITHEEIVKTARAAETDKAALVYEREVSVRYAVDGTYYSSDFRLPVDKTAALGGNSPHSSMASVPSSEHLTLFYNPENPGESTIYQGVPQTAVYSVVFGGVATLVLTMFVFVLASWLSKAGVKLRVKSGGAGENRTHA